MAGNQKENIINENNENHWRNNISQWRNGNNENNGVMK